MAGEIPLSIAGTVENIDVFAEHRVMCTPSAPALLLTRLLEPLLPFDVAGIRANAFMSAGCFGRQGMDELSQQVAALFNSRDPKRTIFPSGLAFDLISTIGSHSDWTPAERRISVEIASLLRIPPQQFAVGLSVVPTFSGIVFTGQMLFTALPEVEQITQAWEAAEWIQMSDPPPGPRRLVGQPRLYAGRVRLDPMGDGVHFWAAGDNLRAGATANVMALLSTFQDDGLL